MKKETDSLPGSCLMQMGCTPCEVPDGMNPMGKCFRVPDDVGSGTYWYYEKPGMFAIGIIDIVLNEDHVMEYRQPEYIALDWFDTISAEELNPYRRINANTLRGHISQGELFRAQYHRNIPIRGMEIMFMPGYYRDYLQTRYPGEFTSPEEAFRSVDGMTIFPELELLMRQISSFEGTGMSAHLFYESKIAETISLIIEKTREGDRKETREQSLTQDDIRNLDTLRGWIDDHFAFDLRTEQLSSIACMGQTKLRSCFRQHFNCTITEYIQSKRISNAQYMLTSTDLNVGQIADAVGYHHAGRFSSLFRRFTGLGPEEYRNLNRK